MIWALLAIFLCYVDRVLISLAAIEMQPEFGWSDSKKGFVLSSFFVGYLIMQLLGGLLANKFGGRNVFLVAVLVWSLFTALTPPASYISFEALILARFMVGFGEGAAFPSVYSLINGWMKKDEVSRSIGYMTASTSAGTIFAFLVAGKMMAVYGWPSAFYIFGLLGLVWAIFWFVLIPAKTPKATREAEIGGRSTKLPTPWKILATHPAALSLYLIAMSGAMISLTLVTWMPSYFADTFGMSMEDAGAYSLLPFIAITFTTVAAGIVGDRLIKAGVPSIRVRKWITYAGFLVSAAALSMITLVNDQLLALACMTASFAALGVAVPGYSVMPAELLPQHGEILYGFMSASATLASTVIIALTGIILDTTNSYDAMFLIMIFGSLSGLLVFAIFGRNDPIYGADEVAPNSATAVV